MSAANDDLRAAVAKARREIAAADLRDAIRGLLETLLAVGLLHRGVTHLILVSLLRPTDDIDLHWDMRATLQVSPATRLSRGERMLVELGTAFLWLVPGGGAWSVELAASMALSPGYRLVGLFLLVNLLVIMMDPLSGPLARALRGTGREAVTGVGAWLRAELRADWASYRDGRTAVRTARGCAEALLGLGIALRVVSHALIYLALSGADRCRTRWRLTTRAQCYPVDRELTARQQWSVALLSSAAWLFLGLAYLAGNQGLEPGVDRRWLALAAANWALLVGDPVWWAGQHAVQVLRPGSSPGAAIRGD